MLKKLEIEFYNYRKKLRKKEDRGINLNLLNLEKNKTNKQLRDWEIQY